MELFTRGFSDPGYPAGVASYRRPPRGASGLPLLALLLFAALATMTGCGGCWHRGDAAAKKAVAEKKAREMAAQAAKKPPFEFQRLTLLPGDETSFLRAVKPGHWMSATQEMRANNGDFAGTLGVTVADNTGRPLGLAGTAFFLDSVRAVSLPKGQWKSLETVFFMPRANGMTHVAGVLHERTGRRDVPISPEFFTVMPAYQYVMVILARHADRYAFVKVLDSVRAPWEESFSFQPVIYYQIVAPRVDQRVPMPSHPLAWTSIAYLIWDDVDGSLFSEEQRQSLLDWLHWGGQLIISGPDSISGLMGSFLAPYLPVTGAPVCALSADDFATLNRYWTVPGKDGQRALLATTGKWSGVRLQLHPLATAAQGTGRLVATRQVGRGRIVVTAFRLDDPRLVRWRSFDSFFNGCLLGRPRRYFKKSASNGELQLIWADHPGREFDPRFVSGLRYFTRDTFVPEEAERRRQLPARVPQRPPPLGTSRGPNWQTAQVASAKALRSVASCQGGNSVTDAARRLLRDAAGITIPRAGFVGWVLAVYLVVLVPVNYLVFRALGRVEWAWIAAPLIALACAGAVVRLARLDIGFARSETEIGVLEAHGGYRRGHLTRYTALYTSLSTSYELRFTDSTALAQPLPANTDLKLVRGQQRSPVTYVCHQAARLRGLRIDSNTTGMFRSEQMWDMGGPLMCDRTAAGRLCVVNDTRLQLDDVVVVRRQVGTGKTPRLDACRIGALAAMSKAALVFRPLEAGQNRPRPADRPATDDTAAALKLTALWQLALDPRLVEPGEVRLVGRIKQRLPGLEVAPSAAQVRAITLVVAHLRLDAKRPAQHDLNLRH